MNGKSLIVINSTFNISICVLKSNGRKTDFWLRIRAPDRKSKNNEWRLRALIPLMFFHGKVLQAGKNDRGFQHLCIKWHLLQAGEGRQYTTQFTVGILSASWTALNSAIQTTKKWWRLRKASHSKLSADAPVCIICNSLSNVNGLHHLSYG